MEENKLDFFREFINKKLIIKSNDGSKYLGRSLCIDGYLNVALEEILLYEDGCNHPINLLNAFIRGNSIEYISINE